MTRALRLRRRLRSRKQTSGDFSGCSTPPGLDPRDPYDLQLGSRMLYGSQDVLLRRKLEEQQQAAELQQAIELQARRFMGLQLLDLKNRSLASAHTLATMAGATPAINVDIRSGSTSSQSGSPPDEMGRIPATAREHEPLRQPSVNAADKEESAAESSLNVDSDFQESNMEHNLPDSPFASPTKASMLTELSLSVSETETVPAEPAAHAVNVNGGNASHLMASPLDMAPFKSCFFQMPRFSSGHGAVGM